jgi:hypothetical protein
MFFDSNPERRVSLKVTARQPIGGNKQSSKQASGFRREPWQGLD